MLKHIRTLALILIALMTFVFAACGNDGEGGGGGDGASNQDGDANDELFVSNAPEVLSRSASSFGSTDVTSMSGDISFDFTMGTMAVSGSADFAMRMPGQMHMAMTFEGGDGQSLVDLSQMGTFELLARDGAIFINMPLLGGWFSLSPEEMDAGFTSVEDLMAQGSPFDYGAFIEKMGEAVEYVGDEDVNGHDTAHYAVTGDLQSLIASFGDALGATGDNAFAEQIMGSEVTGPITVDLWIGKSDFLPYKMTADGEISAGEQGTLVLDLSAEFDDYNGDVTIPEAPANVKSFTEIMAQLGLDPSSLQQ